MQSDQQKEFYKLTESAKTLINDVPVAGSLEEVFSFWRLPSFSDHTRTTLYRPKIVDSNKDSFITVTTWNREADLAKLSDPIERLRHPKDLEPTITEICITLDSNAVSKAVFDLSRISLDSILPDERVIGLDGTGYRFSFSSGYFSLDLSWWCNHPVIWQDSTKEIETIISNLENMKPIKMA